MEDSRHFSKSLTSITLVVYKIEIMFGSRMGFSGSADLMV